MKTILTAILSLVFCTSLIFFNGCSNTTTPVTPPSSSTITVNGKALDTYGNPVSPAATVLIGTQTATTGSDGSFTINNVTTPYDVYVMSSANGVFGVKGLTIANPN